MTLLACEMSATVLWFDHSLALPFFGIGMKTDLFLSCGHSVHSKFAGILQMRVHHFHLLEFEIALLEFHYFYYNCS